MSVSSDADNVTGYLGARPASDLLRAALSAHDNGLCVIPVATNGTKQPWPDSASWKHYQRSRSTPSQINRWFSYGMYDGAGLVCGAVSGNAEMLEFEGRAVVEGVMAKYAEIAENSGLGELWGRVFNGYREVTPSGGVHLVYRVDGVVAGNTKLARRPATAAELAENPDDKIKVLIETRGEGGFVVIAPSGGRTHASGKPWLIQSGGFDTIPTITAQERDALHTLGGALDMMPAPEPAQRPRTPVQARPFGGVRPGDDFNERGTWDEILTPHGWEIHSHSGRTIYWTRPGKRRIDGCSASSGLNDGDNLYVFSTSTVFDAGKPYSKFAAYAVLNHGGDFSAARKELASRGYGSQPTPPVRSVPKPGGAPQVENIIQNHDNDVDTSAWPDEIPESFETPRRLVLTPASQIPCRPVRWLWDTTPEGDAPTSQGRIPMDSLAIAAGGPGLGKSQFAVWLTAQITNGTLPGELYGKPRSVIYAATEDSWAHTITPRLFAAGADLDRVFRVEVQDDGQPHARLTLPIDTSLLGQAAEEYGVALLVADPLLSMIDKTMSDYRAAEVRQALEPLVAAADKHRFTVLGLAHFTKSGGADPLSRIAGSGAFGQIIRSMIAFAQEDDEEGKPKFVMSLAKNNLGRLDMPSHSYEIEAVTVPTEEGPAYVSRFVLGSESTTSVKEVLREESMPDPNRAERNETVKWLRAYLTERGGGAASGEIREEGEKAGFSKSAIYRAKDKLGLVDVQGGSGMARGAYWALPGTKA